MRRYEIIFIVKPNVAEDGIAAITSKATSIIEGDGGTILKINNWGLKKLAYPIKKENQGYYVHLDYAGFPVSVAEIERIFRIDDHVLKYLTVKLADSCDPEAIKEELASLEPVPTSDNPETVEEKSASPEPVPTSDVPEAVEEKSASPEPVPTSDVPDAVEEKSASAETEKVIEEEKSDIATEEPAD